MITLAIIAIGAALLKLRGWLTWNYTGITTPLLSLTVLGLNISIGKP